MVKVKICGITNVEDAIYAVESGADAIGLLPDVLEAPKEIRIGIENAKEIISRLPEKAWTFVLTDSKNFEDIIILCKETGCSHVQIIEDIPVEDLVKIKGALPNVKIVKAICITGKPAIELAEKYGAVSDYILLDSRNKVRRGGTGETHDWNVSSEIVKRTLKPVFLAGGLCSDNVKEAILKVKPYGIDAASRLESSVGMKDPKKVREFIRIAKSL